MRRTGRRTGRSWATVVAGRGYIFLGWSRYHRQDGSNADFCFRQLWDGKGSAEVDQMGPKRLKAYAKHCGATLASAHARTGDAAMITGPSSAAPSNAR